MKWDKKKNPLNSSTRIVIILPPDNYLSPHKLGKAFDGWMHGQQMATQLGPRGLKQDVLNH